MLYEYKGLFYEAFDSDLEYYCEITDPEDIVLFYTDYYQDVEDAEKLIKRILPANAYFFITSFLSVSISLYFIYILRPSRSLR